ncbi:hypothetical protein NHQ30_008592 [Ciborinia camelliae]|nr:hypothetical protein NHQ30_008592 [Ciborinia camelliae]
MEPPPNGAIKRPQETGSSQRQRNHRPGIRARMAQKLSPLMESDGQYSPSANDFPALGANTLLDGKVFENSGGGTAGHVVTGILARPTQASNGTGKVGGREGNNGPRSVSGSSTASVGPEVSSYMQQPLFSRRGNPLPPRAIASGTSTRVNNTTAHLLTNSTPNAFSMNAAAGTSLTHRSAPYEIGKNFDRLRVQGTHLGLATSPYFPKSKEDLVKHREERKNDAKDAMNKKIKQKEELMRLKGTEGCEGVHVKIRPAFGGKVFSDGLSGIFAQKTIWGHPSLDVELSERAEYPTLPELKQAGVRKMGLPIPKFKEDSEEGTAGNYIEPFSGDRVGLMRQRVDDKVLFDEEEINEIGDMKSLFEEIDG